MRRAGLPLAYSLGFSPHPKIIIAMPLPVGCTGEREVLDLILAEFRSADEITRALKPQMPHGISVVSVEEIPLKSPALATLFRQATYHISLQGVSEDELERRVTGLMQRDTIPVEFRGKRFDLAPLIGSLDLVAPAAPKPEPKTSPVEPSRAKLTVLEAVLTRNARGRIGRPDVLLQALELSDCARRIHRAEMVFDHGPVHKAT
jgi:radical SAM-linked protein